MSTLTRILAKSFRSYQTDTSPRDSNDGSSDDTSFSVGPDERVGYQPRRRRRRIVRRLVMLSTLLGAGWGTYTDPTLWPRGWTIVSPYASLVIDAAGNAISSATPSSPVPNTQNAARLPDNSRSEDDTKASEAKTPGNPTPAPRPVLPAAPAEATPATASEPLQKAATDQPTSKTATAAPATGPGDAYTAPPARTSADEPNRRRAEAAGLHPDLSPAILQRLTDADYKSAATAIRKALSEVDDDGVIIWPEKPRAERALFQISFVPGAATDCRRYIVAIAKDGWRTTALPVEKCGVKRVTTRKS